MRKDFCSTGKHSVGRKKEKLPGGELLIPSLVRSKLRMLRKPKKGRSSQFTRALEGWQPLPRAL